MKTCIDKVCEGVLCDDECKDLKPSICGGGMKPIFPSKACGGIPHFDGVKDVAICKGSSFNLRDGVKAYSGSGVEVDFEVSPATIDTDTEGVYTVEYTAVGSGNNMIPQISHGKNKVYASDRLCDTTVFKKERTITVEQCETPPIACEAVVCHTSVECYEYAVTCSAKTCESKTSCTTQG